MIATPLIPPDQAIHLLRLYLKAKDENRPHFIADAFDDEAIVEMDLHTGAISFPARMEGVEVISNVLVRDFGRIYENVYTFYLDKPDNDAAANAYTCDWLVVMSEKATASVRVGCGRYDWQFRHHGQWRIQKLRITIAAMQILPPGTLQMMLNWIHGLGYPWATNEMALAHFPDHRDLEPVRRYLGRRRA